jgi:protein-L-isoaspartate(D-aspartate) O-methyltransferase
MTIVGQMLNEAGLAILRRAYARQMTALAGSADPALERAFASVPREAFLGPPPWRIVRPQGEIILPDADPVHAYQNVLFALDPGRGVNNGEPALHVEMLAALTVEQGARVLHVGAGAGYYTAILAELATATGVVTAVEVDGTLAASARANLVPWPNVSVVHDDGSTWPASEVDRIYVNAAVTRPAARWVEGLAPGGRLVLPLGVPPETAPPGVPRHAVRGGIVVIERVASGFAAYWLRPAYFVMAEGTLTPGAELDALRRAFARGSAEFIRSLVWGGRPDPARCWVWTPDWALSFDPP